jgi:hypothetical protein
MARLCRCHSPEEKRAVGGRGRLLIGPRVFDRLAISGVVRTEGEELQALLSGLKRPWRRGRYTYGVQRTNIKELVAELDSAAAAENDGDLLGVGMAMREGAALAGKQAEQRDTGVLGSQGAARHPGLSTIAESVSRCCVVGRDQVDSREGFRHRTPSLGELRSIAPAAAKVLCRADPARRRRAQPPN